MKWSLQGPTDMEDTRDEEDYSSSGQHEYMNMQRSWVFNHHTRTGFDPFPGMFPSYPLSGLWSAHTPTYRAAAAWTTDDLMLLVIQPFITITAPPFCVRVEWCSRPSPGDCGFPICRFFWVVGGMASLKLATFINSGHPQSPPGISHQL